MTQVNKEKAHLTKEQAMVLVEEFKSLGGAFVEDDEAVTEDGETVYNPMVDRLNAEAWLLDKLMAL